jgi:hypothetical protein
MALPVFGLAESATLAAASPPGVSLGIALQLTNIVRDVGEDLARGRVYVPADDLARFGLTEAELGAAGCARDWRYRALMEYQIDRARGRGGGAGVRTCSRSTHSKAYRDGKVAHRNAKVWHGATEKGLERWTNPNPQRRTRIRWYGVPSCIGKSAGVAYGPVSDLHPKPLPLRFATFPSLWGTLAHFYVAGQTRSRGGGAVRSAVGR